MLRLNNLTSSGKKRKRVGRGGSRGGTSGRGHKGQNARSGGGVRRGFEGGQMPLIRRLPKRGFTNARFKTVFSIVGLDALENIFVDGDTITKDILVVKGLLKRGDKTFKVLGGQLSKKLDIHANAFSQSALNAIAGAGGQATVIKEK